MTADVLLFSPGLDASEATEVLGVSRATFYRRLPEWVSRGLLHPIQPGGNGRVYYSRAELYELASKEGSAVRLAFLAPVSNPGLSRAA